jgi:Fic family protein
VLRHGTKNGRTIGTIFVTASPFDTSFKMTALVDWLNAAIEENEIHPLFIVGVFMFVSSYPPFQDGNGRLSRCLTTLLLLKFG